jgi:hypothetical protein
MALTLLKCHPYAWDAPNTTSSNEFPPLTFPSSSVFITCYLTAVNSPDGHGSYGQARIFISEYVADGKEHNGSWTCLTADKVTQVSFTLTAFDAQAEGVGLVFAT